MNKNYKVGDLVQLENSEKHLLEGKVVDVAPAELTGNYWAKGADPDRAKYFPTYEIELDDGTLMSYNYMNVPNYNLDPRDSELEREFRVAKNQADKEMKEHLNNAYKSLQEALDISRKYGVPVSLGICTLNNEYTPKTFTEKFGDLNEDFVEDLTGVYTDYGYEFVGWKHSAIC